MKWIHNSQSLLDRRRELRQYMTKAEEILWFELRNNKLGAKFKRQHSIGGYITDFYCNKYNLVIELDGKIHDKKENKEYDSIRNEYFSELGYKVVRFPNKEVRENTEKVLEEIKSNFV